MGKHTFGNLSDKDREYIRAVHADSSLAWDERMSILMNRFDRSERTIRRWIKRLGFSHHKEVESEEIREGKLRNYKPSKYYIFTWAQNATPVHLSFWKNIKAYAKYLGAEIGVIQGRYQNPTSIWTMKMQEDEWWDSEVRPYMDGARHQIHEFLDLLSDVKIRPTAVNPLQGFEGISRDRSSILGHPRVHFKALPVIQGHYPKFLLTTGACTIKNYTDTKAGKKAEFHHTYGFVIVEIKDDLTYYIRQVTALDRDGSFIDLVHSVKDEKVTRVKSCEVSVFGDIHSAQADWGVMEEYLSLMQKLKPRRIVLHDLFDGISVNRHEWDNPILQYQRLQQGMRGIKDEVDAVYDLIDLLKLTKYNPIVVRSNHDEFVEKWIQKKDWRHDVANAAEYMEYGLALMRGDASKGVIPFLLEKKYGDKITCLGADEGYRILGWEVGNHGHYGPNGSRGSVNSFRKLNTKMIIGHVHTPERKDGVIAVGTFSKLRMGYNLGPSSWVHAGAIVHENGKAQLITFAPDKKFTTFK